MTIPELVPPRRNETIVSVPCTTCTKPIHTDIPQWEMDILALSPYSFILLTCEHCETTFSYIPASASLVEGEILVNKK
ncbi:MAG: hypothetical protein WAV51_03850 [Microgenomates group bacterium]